MGRTTELLEETQEVFLGMTEDPKGHRTYRYFQIFLTTETWVLENMGGFGEEALATGVRLEDGIRDSWTLVPE